MEQQHRFIYVIYRTLHVLYHRTLPKNYYVFFNTCMFFRTLSKNDDDIVCVLFNF